MNVIDRFYINGAWVAPGSARTMPIKNPAHNSQIGVLSLGVAADVNRAVAAAKNAFSGFAATSKAARLELLQNLLAQTQARQEDLAQAITAEMGAPITMSRAAQAD